MNKIIAAIALTIGSIFTASAQQQESAVPMTTVRNVPLIRLNNGCMMPQFGLGVYALPVGNVTKDAVVTALKKGYRHIDTAHAYMNEGSVGQAIKESGVPREEIWLTSKLWITEYGEGKTLQAVDNMLQRLGVEYMDMIYLHQPLRDYRGAWRDLEKAVEQGKVRAIGISNFDYNDEMFSAIVDSMKIKPAAMQIECHPYAQRKYWQEKLKANGILLESWYPLGGRVSEGELLRDPVINRIARQYNKTAAQVIIRWHIQEGFSVIPGTDNPDYIEENINVFDFKLSDRDMADIRALDKEKRYFQMKYEDLEEYLTSRVHL